jgi:hypothetical protein
MEKEPLTYDQKFSLAIAKFKKLGNKHPAMVWYSEAKFLYSLIPELIELLELGKQFNIDKLTHEEDIAAHIEYIHFVDKVVGEKIDE